MRDSDVDVDTVTGDTVTEGPETLARRGKRLAKEYIAAYKLRCSWYRDQHESFEFSLVVERVISRRLDRVAGLLEHWLKRDGEPLILRSRNRLYRFTIDYNTGHVKMHHARLTMSRSNIGDD